MSIKTVENINLLKQILKNTPLAKSNSHRFTQILQNEVEKMHQQRFQYQSNLIKMNKEIIRNLTNFTKTDQNNTPQSPPISQNFEARLKEQQENFLKLSKPQKPQEIDFSDKTENDSIPSLDTTMQQREKELKAIMQDYTPADKAGEWINKSDTEKNHKLKIHKTPKIIINPKDIVKPTNIKEKRNTAPKKVSFHITDNHTDNHSFYNKLKTKNPIPDSIDSHDTIVALHQLSVESIDIQREILEIQKQILKSLKDLSKFPQT